MYFPSVRKPAAVNKRYSCIMSCSLPRHVIPFEISCAEHRPLTDLLHQIEVAFQFVIGTFDSTGTYCDEFRAVVARYLTKVRGFWFDCVTSVPWSYMDLVIYVVQTHPNLYFSSAAPKTITWLLGS